MSVQNKNADYGGARGSNAGDQFHELWALEQILGLLDPARGLAAVSVEGVAYEGVESAGSEPCWDGVDCGLYFGGTTLDTADRVEFVQLKYSGDPSAPWTIARLTKTSAKKVNNSVLRKFAVEFKDAIARIKPGAEIKVRFVSNQPLSEKTVRFFQWGANGAAMPDDLKADYAQVVTATGLDASDLSAFLAALDLTECGTTSRFEHREKVVLAVARLLEDQSLSDVANLRQHVRDLMLPERHREWVKFQTVLSWFGIADRAGLFPCPQNTVVVEHPIVRAVAQEVAEALKTSTSVVCIQGPGGCGKTTAIKQLSDLLPDGSCFLLFDCFGGGRYLFSNDKRHLPERAFLQIANDLALALQVPFLIPHDGRRPIDVRQFLSRVSDAAAIFTATRPEALLVIAVDAADNAVTAAEKSQNEPCFVHQLCNADLGALPSNVRIVFSSRTARVDSLQLPSSARRFECPPFSRLETVRFIRGIWPEAKDAWIEQFHNLSHAIPRVQNYAVKASGNDQTKALDALRPNGKGLQQILKEQFEQALVKLGYQPIFDSIIGALAALPPPIPIIHLAAVAGTSKAVIYDFVHDLIPGLRVEREEVLIADEDFEDFVKAEAQPKLCATRLTVADYLLQHCRTVSYAAIHVADALINVGRGAELLSLLEDSETLRVISDPIVRREVQLRRLRLALTACRKASSIRDTLKVILISADANQDESVLKELLSKEVDLSVWFAWPTLKRLVLTDRENVEHQGAVLVQGAAQAARAADKITARERLTSYDAWLQRRREVNDNERSRWHISDEDLVARAETIFEIAGIEAVIEDLQHWTPRTISVRVALRLVPLLIVRGRVDALKEAFDKGLLREPWNLLLSIPLALAGHDVGTEKIAYSLKRIKSHHVPDLDRLDSYSSNTKWEEALFELFLTACELALSSGVDRDVVLKVLGILRGGNDFHLRRSGATAAGSVIRIWLLEKHLKGGERSLDKFFAEVTSNDKSSEPVKAGRKQHRKPEPSQQENGLDDEVKTLVGGVFPIYAGRLTLITKPNGNPPIPTTHQKWS